MLISVRVCYRTVLSLKNVAQMCVVCSAAWQAVSQMIRPHPLLLLMANQVQMCPLWVGPAAMASCAVSRERSV